MKLEDGREEVGIPRITGHDFRYNLTTVLVEAGVDQHLVQAIIGHKSKEMTAHYSHVRPEVKAAVLKPLVEAWS